MEIFEVYRKEQGAASALDMDKCCIEGIDPASFIKRVLARFSNQVSVN